MTNVSRTNRNGHRPRSDFYPTRAWTGATQALIVHEGHLLPAGVDEPAAGSGDMVAVLRGFGRRQVYATELRRVSRRGIIGGVNFLKRAWLKFRAVVTNPPYRKVYITVDGRKVQTTMADLFIRHALQLGARYIAMFLPLSFLAGVGRSDIMEMTGTMRLRRVYVFRERLTLSPAAMDLETGGVVTYAWLVWSDNGPAAGKLPLIKRISPVLA